MRLSLFTKILRKYTCSLTIKLAAVCLTSMNFITLHSFILFFQFFSKTIDEVDDEEWTVALGMEFGGQISLYTNQADDKVGNCSQHRATRARSLGNMVHCLSTIVFALFYCSLPSPSLCYAICDPLPEEEPAKGLLLVHRQLDLEIINNA